MVSDCRGPAASCRCLAGPFGVPPLGGQNADMPLPLRLPGIRRRSCLLPALPSLPRPALATDVPLREAMRRAEALRDEALRASDQPFGAVVLPGELIVGVPQLRRHCHRPHRACRDGDYPRCIAPVAHA